MRVILLTSVVQGESDATYTTERSARGRSAPGTTERTTRLQRDVDRVAVLVEPRQPARALEVRAVRRDHDLVARWQPAWRDRAAEPLVYFGLVLV